MPFKDLALGVVADHLGSDVAHDVQLLGAEGSGHFGGCGGLERGSLGRPVGEAGAEVTESERTSEKIYLPGWD